MNQNTVDNNIIYGSGLTWTQGWLANGTLDTSKTTYLSTTDYIAMSMKTLTFIGTDPDANNVKYYLYVTQYDSGKNYIVRTGMMDGGAVEYDLYDNCAYIKLSFGHGSSSGVVPANADDLVLSVEPRKANRFLNMSKVTDSGDTEYSVSDNILSIKKWKATGSYNLSIPFGQPLGLSAGDTVRVVITRTSGSVNSGVAVYVMVGGNVVISNKTWSGDATAMDQSGTVPSSPTNTLYVSFRNSAATRTYTNYKVSIKVYLNGTQVLPEVST